MEGAIYHLLEATGGRGWRFSKRRSDDGASHCNLIYTQPKVRAGTAMDVCRHFQLCHLSRCNFDEKERVAIVIVSLQP